MPKLLKCDMCTIMFELMLGGVIDVIVDNWTGRTWDLIIQINLSVVFVFV